MNEKIKKICVVFGAFFLIWGIVIIPVLATIGMFYLSIVTTQVGLTSGYPEDINSYFSGSMVCAVFCFMWFVWLFQSGKLKISKEKKTSE